MTADEAPPSTRADSVRMRALVAASLLILIVLVILQATPTGGHAPAPVSSTPFFEREPAIRVRIATLEPGQEIAVSGVAGSSGSSSRIANKAGAPERDGRPCVVPCVLEPAGGAEIAVLDRKYHGDLVVLSEPGSGRVHLVNRLGIELYLEGVVLSEMPPDYPDEALHAQAIASRSYAAFQMLVRKDRLFDVTDTQRSQVYKGAPTQLELARRVVRQTRGRVLAFDGKILEAVFSSTCGGTTRSAEEAFGDQAPEPLRGVRCGLCDGTQFSTWTARVGRAEAGRALGLGGPLESLEDARFHPSGRLLQVTAIGAKATKPVTGNQLRDALPAGRSTWFTSLAIDGDSLTAEGRGFGHGVGMCQVGASRLAGAGRDHAAILAHYYPGATLAWLHPVHDG